MNQKFRIIIQDEAAEDIRDAIRWYNRRQSGLGRKFYQEVYRCIEELRLNPFYQIRYENSRCLPLKKFPFMVHYALNEKRNVIHIQAVFHTSRSPTSWGTSL